MLSKPTGDENADDADFADVRGFQTINHRLYGLSASIRPIRVIRVPADEKWIEKTIAS